MINFIDEEKLVDKFIKNKKLINSNTYTYLVAYAKYLKHKGLSKVKIRNELDIMMYTYYNGFCMADFDTIIQKVVNKYTKKETYEYKKPREINITVKELEYIRQKQDENIEHLLFTLLVLAKINDIDTKDFIVVFDEADIFKISKYKYQTRSKPRIEQRNIKLNDLKQLGYIEFGKIFNSQSIKLLYGTREFDENGINITITDDNIDDLTLHYHKWKGDKKIIECEVCGKLVEVKPKSSQKYCVNCSKKVKNDMNKSYYRNNI